TNVVTAADPLLRPTRSRPRPRPTLFPYTTLFRSGQGEHLISIQHLLKTLGCPNDTGDFKAPLDAGLSIRGAVARHTATDERARVDRKSTRLNSSHVKISYAVFCLKKKIPNDLAAT